LDLSQSCVVGLAVSGAIELHLKSGRLGRRFASVAGDWRARDGLGGEYDALEQTEQALTPSADDLLGVPGSATPHQQNRLYSASRKAPPSRLSLQRLNHYGWLAAITVAALGVRVWFVIDRWNVGPGVGTDQYWYHNVGLLIVSGKGISNPVVYALTG
jgi:hypothetical protein